MSDPLCNFYQVRYKLFEEDGVSVPVCPVFDRTCRYSGQKINNEYIVCEKRLLLDKNINPDEHYKSIKENVPAEKEPGIRWPSRTEREEHLEKRLM